jgi:DNA-binding response OmpR family regulator
VLVDDDPGLRHLLTQALARDRPLQTRNLQAEALGSAAVVSKPFNLEHLLNTVTNIVG